MAVSRPNVLIINIRNIYTKFSDKTINITPKFKYGLIRTNENKIAANNKENKTLKMLKPLKTISGDLMEETEELKYRKMKTKNKNPNTKLNLNIKGEIIYGIHPILLALKAKKRNFYTLYLKNHFNSNSTLNPRLKEIKKMAEDLNIQIKYISNDILDILSDHRPHQSVCIDCGYLKTKFLDPNTMENDTKMQIWLLLENIKDPMNLGAIIRTAYFMGIDKIISTQINSCPLTPIVSKASSGAMEISPYFYIDDVIEFLKVKRANGWDIVGTVIENDGRSVITNLNDFEMTKSTVLIIGNEGEGLDENVLKLCSYNISIESGDQSTILALNVSVATGIILHSIIRNKKL